MGDADSGKSTSDLKKPSTAQAKKKATSRRKSVSTKPKTKVKAPDVSTASEKLAEPTKPKTPRPRGRRSQSKEAITEQAKQTTVVVLAMMNSVAVFGFGEQARMNRGEQMMIENSMQRILERLDIQESEAVARYSDPLMLIMGLIGWGARVWRDSRKSDDDDRGDQKKEPEPKPPEDEKKKPSGDNDRNHEEEIADTVTATKAPKHIQEMLTGH